MTLPCFTFGSRVSFAGNATRSQGNVFDGGGSSLGASHSQSRPGSPSSRADICSRSFVSPSSRLATSTGGLLTALLFHLIVPPPRNRGLVAPLASSQLAPPSDEAAVARLPRHVGVRDHHHVLVPPAPALCSSPARSQSSHARTPSPVSLCAHTHFSPFSDPPPVAVSAAPEGCRRRPPDLPCALQRARPRRARNHQPRARPRLAETLGLVRGPSAGWGRRALGQCRSGLDGVSARGMAMDRGQLGEAGGDVGVARESASLSCLHARSPSSNSGSNRLNVSCHLLVPIRPCRRTLCTLSCRTCWSSRVRPRCSRNTRRSSTRTTTTQTRPGHSPKTNSQRYGFDPSLCTLTTPTRDTRSTTSPSDTAGGRGEGNASSTSRPRFRKPHRKLCQTLTSRHKTSRGERGRGQR